MKFELSKEDQIETLISRILRSKLVICNHYGTILHYSLNIPVVCYWNKEVTNIFDCDENKQIFESLVSSKILFFNHLEASDHINKIYKKIDDWWFQMRCKC